MMRLVLVYILAFLCLTNCKNTSEAEAVTTTLEVNNTSFGNIKYQLPPFSEAAKQQKQQWTAFEDFENGVSRFYKNTIDEIRNNTEFLLNATDSISKTIPDTLNQKSIYARLLVTKTKAAMLHQEVRKSRVDSANVAMYLKELYKASDNLVLQINEKFEREAVDVARIEEEEKERQKQERFLDSVYKAELQDQKN